MTGLQNVAADAAQNRQFAAPSPDSSGTGAHIAVLLELASRSGTTREAVIKDWNAWIAAQRAKEPRFVADLSRLNATADAWKDTPLLSPPLWQSRLHDDARDWLMLTGIDLRGANLSWANLKRVCLDNAMLAGANLSAVDFEGAHLWDADLTGASLEYANLDGAFMTRTKLRGANLTYASIARAILSGADITGADFRMADITQADFGDALYRHYRGVWPFRSGLMLGKFLGIRGADSCYGNPEFRRDALDQDFIDSKYRGCRLNGGWRALPLRLVRRLFFWLWSLSDYGRSVLSVALFAAVFIAGFGAAYAFCLIPAGDVSVTGELARLPAIPHQEWYAAAMGAATLGLTDLLHPSTVLGEGVMLTNVLSGFFLFGMMVAVLQNKFARRA